MLTVQEYSSQFAIKDRLSFAHTEPGLIKAVMENGSAARAEVYLQGATVTSWIPYGGSEVLFLSRQAEFKTDKAIRGGIPLVFPQFGPGSLPSHGFARNRAWKFTGSRAERDLTEIVLELSQDSQTLSLWPHRFLLRLRVALGSSLEIELTVQNHGEQAFLFENAFHTYFRVDDISKVSIPGLHGKTYLDNAEKRARKIDQAGDLKIDREVDRVYLQCGRQREIVDSGLSRRINITGTAINDAVVWNPWVEKSKSLADLADEEYRNFICVETGNIAAPIRLAADERFVCKQVLEVGAI